MKTGAHYIITVRLRGEEFKFKIERLQGALENFNYGLNQVYGSEYKDFEALEIVYQGD